MSESVQRQLSEKAKAAALKEAKKKGLPDGWTVTLDKRNRRKWISPTGRTCDSIPKAISISIELGMLPSDTPVAVNSKAKKSKKRPAASSLSTPAAKKVASPARPQPEPYYVFDEDEDPGPESDPETSLDVIPRLASNSTRHTTVHWDPDTPEGRKVGWRIRIWDSKQWRGGRIVRYDPYSHKHKVKYDGKPRRGEGQDGCVWLRLMNEVYQCSTRIVWAHVKGFAWWPATILECDPPTFGGSTYKEGYEFLSFFGSEEFATLKDSPECIRPFCGGKIDTVIAKHKKKRDSKAIKLATEEEIEVRSARNAACRFYATKAFGFSTHQGNFLLGKKIQLFRSNVNYPYGDTVVATARLYNAVTKKWLLSYEISEQTRNKYEPSWVNLQAKDCKYKVLDKKKHHDPTPVDLVPFIHGFQLVDDAETVEDESSDAFLSKLLFERCRGCVGYLLNTQQKMTCTRCGGKYHTCCVELQQQAKPSPRAPDAEEGWICSKCIICRGCHQHDIAFGVHPQPAPPRLSLPSGETTLNLCSMCTTSYEQQRFCPNCAHTWDDVKYQRFQRRIRWEGDRFSPKSLGSRRKHQAKDSTDIDDDGDKNDENDDVSIANVKIDPSWYHPDSPVWGFTAGTMLVCDGCDLWVHAGCAGLSEEEYEQTSNGEHPIYSQEFLCRSCCRQRCKELIEGLQKEDKLFLFAAPVTEEMAPTYHDVIKNPMDLQTMSEVAEHGNYLNYAWVREDFELMVLNALTFNRPYTKFWDEAKRFHETCIKSVFSEMGKAAPPGRYAQHLSNAYQKAIQAKQLEAERVKEDETAEKKDLVAGSNVAKISLPVLRQPHDQQSCVQFRMIRMKSLDAYFSSWQDCCFVCGSSGAADTFLFCVDCGEAYHSFCASAPIHSMEASSVAGWRCPNCKICEISGSVPHDELRMLFCEMCDRAFSLDLLDPPLESAPPGLWICGQCVDCKTCGNSSEERGISLKYWSRDPQKCYRCGGCEGLELKDAPASKCPICLIYLRSQDGDVVKCSSCSSSVHTKCDMLAAEYVNGRVSSIRQQSVKYDCPACRRKLGTNREHYEKLRKDLHDQAWMPIIEGPLNPTERNWSFLETHARLCEQIDFEIRNTWRDEYVDLIKEAFRVLTSIKETFSNPSDALSDCTELGLPLWMGQRAARFIRFAVSKGWNVDELDDKRIAVLVEMAKMAASFLKVACRKMGMKTKKTVKCYDRMTSLLKSPDVCGFVEKPMDIIRVDGNCDIIQAREWLSKIEPELPLEDIGLTKVRKSSLKKKRSAQVEVFKVAAPMCGWNDSIDESDDQNRWKDPRECCLCHMCGDDDAGFQAARKCTVYDVPRADVSRVQVAPVGRLLPMSDGLWVHAFCALWSSEVWEAATGGLVNAVEKARSRGSQLKCFGCGRPGATVGCFKQNCSSNYHFPCAKACGAVFTSSQQMFCSMHKEHASDALSKESYEPMKTLIIAVEKKATADKDLADGTENSLFLRVGCIVVHSLGTIEQKQDGFHSEDYITPRGYMATRIFWSAKTPRTRTVYVLRIEMSRDNAALFSITPGDDPANIIRSSSAAEAHSMLIKRVKETNRAYFSQDLYSRLPVQRRTTKKTYGLNAPQFFGFGLDYVRKVLETLPGVEAVVAPLTKSSPAYRFCFSQPSVEAIMDLQRKRAAVAAEKALENPSGSARTEGIQAVAQSGGSGRITRALVRSVEEEMPSDAKRTDQEELKAKADRESNQRKYREMKSVPMEQRLVARRSHIHGWGLFCKIDLPKDSMIVEYMGEAVRRCVADKRENFYEKSGIGSCYMFRLDLQRIVDATIIGCMARFMNHCCQPNAYAKVITVDTELGPDKKIVVFANRDIEAGEEITYDYKFPVEDGSLRCTCGAPNCIGRMN